MFPPAVIVLTCIPTSFVQYSSNRPLNEGISLTVLLRTCEHYNHLLKLLLSCQSVPRCLAMQSIRIETTCRTPLPPLSEFTMLTGFPWESRSFANQPDPYALVLSVIYRQRPPPVR